VSDWNCTVESDGAVRLGLRYVSGLREEVGRAIAAVDRRTSPSRPSSPSSPSDLICPKCGCDDPSMLEPVEGRGTRPGTYFCNNCSHDWIPGTRPRRRFASLDELVARTGLRRDEIVTLADIGALNAFGYDRRAALWQAERAVRPTGELFEDRSYVWPSYIEPGAASVESGSSSYVEPGVFPYVAPGSSDPGDDDVRVKPGSKHPGSTGEPVQRSTAETAEGSTDGVDAGPTDGDESSCPLRPMTESERLVADYAGTGLTVGRHPMALRRDELAMRGILRAVDLRSVRQGRRVRVAGMVITRQRPGTAKGFVFLTLEDETGIANIIVRPDLFARDRGVIVEEPFLMIEGVLQNQDGVTSVRAETVQGLGGQTIDFDAHDFY
jgi:error-prone DNA polymerase